MTRGITDDYTLNREQLRAAARRLGFEIYAEAENKLMVRARLDGATIRLHILQRARAAHGSSTICSLTDDRAKELRALLRAYEAPERFNLRLYDGAGSCPNTVALGYTFSSFDARSLAHHLNRYAREIVALSRALADADVGVLHSWVINNMRSLEAAPPTEDEPSQMR